MKGTLQELKRAIDLDPWSLLGKSKDEDLRDVLIDEEGRRYWIDEDEQEDCSVITRKIYID